MLDTKLNALLALTTQVDDRGKPAPEALTSALIFCQNPILLPCIRRILAIGSSLLPC